MNMHLSDDPLAGGSSSLSARLKRWEQCIRSVDALTTRGFVSPQPLVQEVVQPPKSAIEYVAE